MFDAFDGAVDELAWRFGSAASALGIRGQSIGDGKAGVFDAASSHRAHMSRRTLSHRWAVQRLAKVDATLAEIDRDAVATLTKAFTPYGRASSRLARHFAVTDGVSADPKVHLLGIAVETHTARTGCARGTHAIPRAPAVLEWLETSADRSALDAVKREAVDTVYRALAIYDAARTRRLDREKAERRDRSAADAARRDAHREAIEAKEREKRARHMPQLAALAEVVKARGGIHLTVVEAAE